MHSDGGNAGDPKTRVLLAKSHSDSMISGPQHEDPQKSIDRIPLDGWRRAALYRSANKRLNGLQRAGLETAAGKAAAITEKAKGGFMKSKNPHKRSSTRSG